jgi:hypothetical protein
MKPGWEHWHQYIGVTGSMAYFPFSGWKESFFAIVHGQERNAIEFYTETKVGGRALGERTIAQILIFSVNLCVLGGARFCLTTE